MPAGIQTYLSIKTVNYVRVDIRKVKEADIEELLQFEKRVIEAERPFDNTLKEGAIHYYDLLELIGSERAEVLVAVVNGEMVGSGYAKILPAKLYQKFTEYAYLGFMYVKPPYRGQGINQKLLPRSLTGPRLRT